MTIPSILMKEAERRLEELKTTGDHELHKDWLQALVDARKGVKGYCSPTGCAWRAINPEKAYAVYSYYGVPALRPRRALDGRMRKSFFGAAH